MFLGLLRGQIVAFPSPALWLSAERPKCEILPLVGDAHGGFPQPGFVWLCLSPALASHPGISPGAEKRRKKNKRRKFSWFYITE